MFIKCLTIIIYIASLLFVVYFSFVQSLESWSKGNNLDFVLLMILILFLIMLIVIASIHFSTTIKSWRELSDSKNDFDKIVD